MLTQTAHCPDLINKGYSKRTPHIIPYRPRKSPSPSLRRKEVYTSGAVSGAGGAPGLSAGTLRRQRALAAAALK